MIDIFHAYILITSNQSFYSAADGHKYDLVFPHVHHSISLSVFPSITPWGFCPFLPKLMIGLTSNLAYAVLSILCVLEEIIHIIMGCPVSCYFEFTIIISILRTPNSNISSTLVSNKSVDHSDVVGASPVSAAPTTSSFSTYWLASMDWAKTTARRDEKHLSLGIWRALY